MIDHLGTYANWLSDRYRPSVKPLGVLRILFGLFVLISPPDYEWAGEVPAETWDPAPGLPLLFDGPPSSGFLDGLELLRLLVAVWLITGARARAASISMTAILLTGSAITNSFGKIDHTILFELVPLALGFAGWGAAYSLDAARRKRQDVDGYALLLWSAVIAFAIFTAAVPKALTGWLSFDRQGSLAFVASDVADGHKTGLLAPWLVSQNHTWLWKALDISTVILEGWLIVAVLLPAAFRLGLLILIAFHVGVYLSLGINFGSYIFVYAAFFCLPPREWFSTLAEARRWVRSASRDRKLDA